MQKKKGTNWKARDMVNESIRNTSKCVTSYSGKIYMEPGQIDFLVAYDIVTSLLNLIFNGLVITALLLTKQTDNPSLKLILLLSVSDCCMAVIVQPLFAAMLLQYPSTQNCSFEMAMQFFGIFFTHTSGYIIALIGFDRYARVKFLTKYSQVMTASRIKKAVIVMTFLSFMQGAIYVIGTRLEIFETTKQVAVAIDFIIVLAVVLFTVMAVRAVKEHRKNADNQSMMEAVDKTMTRLASKILLTIIVFYISYVVIAFLHSSQAEKSSGAKRSWLEFALFFGYLLTYTNSLVNAIIFLSFNNKARHILVKKVTSQYRKSQPGTSSKYNISETHETSSRDHDL